MDYSCKQRSLDSLVHDIKSGKISFTHKLQRPEGQWSTKMKADLIDSIFRKYPINPTYAVIEADNKEAIIDGVQRLSTVRDYLDNKFALSKDMESVVINGEEKNLAGLKYEDLDDDIKNELGKSELQIYRITDYTEKDVREMFRRQNSGKPVSSKLLRVVYESDEFSTMINDFINHPFMDKITTPVMRKNGSDRDIIIQTFMLIACNQTEDYTSFRSKDVNAFIASHSDFCLEKATTLKEAMDRYNTAFEGKIKIAITSIPMLLYAGYKVTKNKGSYTKLIEIVLNFLRDYDSNEEYKQFVQRGTGSSANVRGRFDYWRNLVKSI